MQPAQRQAPHTRHPHITDHCAAGRYRSQSTTQSTTAAPQRHLAADHHRSQRHQAVSGRLSRQVAQAPTGSQR
ncbi:MAG: hypothetical protein AAFP03_17930 [Cyanobacteria bacterium J06598_3]